MRTANYRHTPVPTGVEQDQAPSTMRALSIVGPVNLRILAPVLAVVRLDGASSLPPWFALDAPFSAALRRDGELSLVVAEERVPDDVAAERGWRALEVAGPLDLALTGVTASLSGALARAGVSILPLATHDTDVFLVRAERLDDAVAALRAAGHNVTS